MNWSGPETKDWLSVVLEECANYIIMDTVRQIVIEGTVCGNGEPVMSGIHSLGGGGWGGGTFLPWMVVGVTS